MKLLAFILAAASFCAVSHAQSAKALLLFGGEDHKTYLGCLNCSAHSESSVCNEYGKYGSPYQSGSIWNQFGTFGSEYNTYSPWNQYSSNAPIIVDQDGKSYGYFSANAFHHDRTRIGWLVRALDLQAKKSELDATRALICED